MTIRNGEGRQPDADAGQNTLCPCTETGPFVCPEGVYYSELLQRSTAWILLAKGVRSTEQEALELGASWMAALLEQVGRQARLFATLRGTAAVNYCDIKQSLRLVCPSAYALLFAASVDPVAPRLPRQLPMEPAGPSLVMSDESWLLADLIGQRRKSQAGPLPQSDAPQKNHHPRRPAHVPEYLPKYPPAHLYQRTEAPWALEVAPQVAEFRRKYRKLELQLHLPQLQLPEPLPETAQPALDRAGSAGEGFWGVPSSRDVQHQQQEMGGQQEEEGEQQNTVPPARRLRKAEPGAGDRPAHDLYLR